MQKNVPKYTPSWVRTERVWAEASKREVSYALCNDRRTLIWFANQRAVEYHPALARIEHPDRMTHLVVDLDPPEGESFAAAVRVAHLVHAVLTDAGLSGSVKTSGAKGIHVFVPIDDHASTEDAAAALRAIAARVERLDPAIATTAFMKEDRSGKVFVDATRGRWGHGGRGVQPSGPAGYARSRSRSTGPISTTSCRPTSRSTPRSSSSAPMIRGPPGWRVRSALSDELIAEGREIPVPRVQAMHEGKRRARARRA